MTDTQWVERPPEPTLLQRVGGVSGLVYANIPVLTFVVADAVAGLDVAVGVAIGAGAGITVLRLLRKEPLQPAVSGLLGVAIAAAIAVYTGSARDFFLPGIWLSLASAILFTASVVVRRPLVGVIWSVFTGAGNGWRADASVRRAFDYATSVFVAVFVSRFVVQQWLYDAGATGWLAFARIAMGFPLLALALLVSAWAIRRSNRSVSPNRE